MALSGTALGPLLASAVGVSPSDATGQAAWLAIANVLVNYIKTNGLVTLNPGTVASGVTSGAASAPVTGTGTIT